MPELFIIVVLYSEPTIYYHGLSPAGRALMTDALEDAAFLTKEEADQVLAILNRTSQLHFTIESCGAVTDEGEDLEPI